MSSGSASSQPPDAGIPTASLDSIAKLETTAPAIFVPITEDFTAPLPAVPVSKSSQLQSQINQFVKHSNTVQSNITNLHRREALRQSLDPSSHDGFSTESRKHSLTDEDRVTLLKNVEAVHNSREQVDASQRQIPWPAPKELTTPQTHYLLWAMEDRKRYWEHRDKKLEELRAQWREARDRETPG